MPDETDTGTPLDPRKAFGAELVRWRKSGPVKLNQTGLAVRLDCHPSYISKIESGREPPNEGFAREADKVLEAGGLIVKAWRKYDKWRKEMDKVRRPAHDIADVRDALPGTPVIDIDELRVTLALNDPGADSPGTYTYQGRYELDNGGDEVITQFPLWMPVLPGAYLPPDWITGTSQKAIYSEELRFSSILWPDEEPTFYDPDEGGEVWVVFENNNGTFPLYPDDSTEVRYGFHLPMNDYTEGIQRIVRLPTRILSVHISLPSFLHPIVYAWSYSLSTHDHRLDTRIQEYEADGVTHFEWAIANPPLLSSYTFGWRSGLSHGNVDEPWRKQF